MRRLKKEDQPIRTSSLILTAALAVALTPVVAGAAELPRQYRGLWCGETDSEASPIMFRGRNRCPTRSGDNVMFITAKGYGTEESICEATRVIVRDTNLLTVKFLCASLERVGPGGDVSQDANAAALVLNLRLLGNKLLVKAD